MGPKANTNTSTKTKPKPKPKPVPKSSTGPVDQIDQSRRSAQPTNARTAPSRLKVVVRRLPPALPEAVFWSSVASWVTHPADSTAPPVSTSASNKSLNSVDWVQYRSGKVRARHDKDDTHSRAYLSFKTPEALVAFHRAYDGWNFKAKTGQVTRAVVEFAPYQNTPSGSNKRDPRQGTIEQDPDFIAFQDALANPNVPQVELPAKITPTSTPLLDHLRAQKAASRATSRGKVPAPAQVPPLPKPSKRSKKGSAKETHSAVVAATASATQPLNKTPQRMAAQKSVAIEQGGLKSDLKSARGLKQKGKAKTAEAKNQVVATKSRVTAATDAAQPKQARHEPPPTQAAGAAELVRRTLQTEHQAKYESGALAKPSPPQKKDTRHPKDQSTRGVPQILKNPARKPSSPVPTPAAAPAASSSTTGPSSVSSAASVPPSAQVSSGLSSRGAQRHRGTCKAGSPLTPTDTRPLGTSAPLSEQTARLGSYPSQPGTSVVNAQSGNGSGQSSSRGGGGGRGRGRSRGRGGGGTASAGAGAGRGGRLTENAPQSGKPAQNTQAGAKPVIATT